MTPTTILDPPTQEYALTDDTIDKEGPNQVWKALRTYMSDQKENVEQQLDRIAALGENWDGYGAAVIDPGILVAARDLFARLDSPENLPKTHVLPTSDGSVQFEWEKGKKLLEIEIESADTARFLKWDPENHIEEEGVFPVENKARLQELVNWLRRDVIRV